LNSVGDVAMSRPVRAAELKTTAYSCWSNKSNRTTG
jgi:hypothetical protein